METKNTDLSALKIDRTEKPVNPNRRKKFYITVLSITIIAALVLLYVFRNSFIQSETGVTLAKVTYQTSSQNNSVFTANGYVVAQRKAAVASKGTGQLVYLGVVEGDKVKKNQVIAKLEDNDVQVQLLESKANLELQKANLKEVENVFKRQLQLNKSGLTSQEQVDAAEANYKKVLASIEVAKAQIKAAEVAVENTVIRAPFDGTVLTKNADVGEIVAPLAGGANSKAAVVTIADMHSLQVETDVSESNIERILLNQNCEIMLDAYPNKSYPGYVAKIVPTADRTKATVMVKVGFKHYDKRVLPEMSAKVIFLSQDSKNTQNNEQPVLVVPNSALVESNGQFHVFIINNNRAIELPVKIGRRFDSFSEVKEGLKEGDQVIENVSGKIKNGTEVKIKS